jgi:hypothetical protein
VAVGAFIGVLSCRELELIDEQLDEDRSLDGPGEDGALAAVEDHKPAVGEEFENYVSERFGHGTLLSMSFSKMAESHSVRTHRWPVSSRRRTKGAHSGCCGQGLPSGLASMAHMTCCRDTATVVSDHGVSPDALRSSSASLGDGATCAAQEQGCRRCFYLGAVS